MEREMEIKKANKNAVDGLSKLGERARICRICK